MLPFSRVIYDQLLYSEWGCRYYGTGQRDRNERQRRKEREIEARATHRPREGNMDNRAQRVADKQRARGEGIHIHASEREKTVLSPAAPCFAL